MAETLVRVAISLATVQTVQYWALEWLTHCAPSAVRRPAPPTLGASGAQRHPAPQAPGTSGARCLRHRRTPVPSVSPAPQNLAVLGSFISCFWWFQRAAQSSIVYSLRIRQVISRNIATTVSGGVVFDSSERRYDGSTTTVLQGYDGRTVMVRRYDGTTVRRYYYSTTVHDTVRL